jgi:hypothetical protein
VLCKPVSAADGACAHVFCRGCLAEWTERCVSWRRSAPSKQCPLALTHPRTPRSAPEAATCPICRVLLRGCAPAKAAEKQLAATSATCTCGVAVRLSAARSHLAKCKDAGALAAATAAAMQRGRVVAGHGPAAEALAAEPAGAGGPNRATFACPLCPAGAPASLHLDCAALVAHVNAAHAQDPRPAVCPVCAAMPWGDSAYVSRHFVQHVGLRHRFEYGAFTAYDEDDDAIMRRVLAESAREAGEEAGGAGGAGGFESDE